MTRLLIGLPAVTPAGYAVNPMFLMELDRHLDMYDNYWKTFDKTLFQFLYVNIAL